MLILSKASTGLLNVNATKTLLSIVVSKKITPVQCRFLNSGISYRVAKTITDKLAFSL